MSTRKYTNMYWLTVYQDNSVFTSMFTEVIVMHSGKKSWTGNLLW